MRHFALHRSTEVRSEAVTISTVLLWPIRRLASRLYRPYIELMEGLAVPGEPQSLGVSGERWGLAETRKLRSHAVGVLLREHREFAGYSRVVLGDRLGISPEQLERWELVGVPIPPSDRVLALTDFLDIPESAVHAATSDVDAQAIPGARNGHRSRTSTDGYGAAPVLENAIVFHGWTPEEVAQALATSPTKVQAWRQGAIEMTTAERLALTGLVRIRTERAGE
jgi:transcriptional regulator with XRE-family HTH domain